MAHHHVHQGGQIMFGSRIPTLHPHILIFDENTSTPTQPKQTETPPTQSKNTPAHPPNQIHFRREEGERTEPTKSFY